MEPAELPPRTVHGVSCRTGHADAARDIGALWERAGTAQLLGRGSTAVAVYHDYTVRSDGYDVTVTVGYEASADTALAPGLDRVEVPGQRCARFDTDGSIDQVVAVWQQVWQQWPDGGPRSFAADVEIWHQGPDGRPQSAEVYVGIRG